MPVISIRCNVVVVVARDADGANDGTCNWLAKATEHSYLESKIAEKLWDVKWCVRPTRGKNYDLLIIH